MSTSRERRLVHLVYSLHPQRCRIVPCANSFERFVVHEMCQRHYQGAVLHRTVRAGPALGVEVCHRNLAERRLRNILSH